MFSDFLQDPVVNALSLSPAPASNVDYGYTSHPYELNLAQNQPRTLRSPSSWDNPFGPAELERVLRPFDSDASLLPNRLPALLDYNAGSLMPSPTTTSGDVFLSQASTGFYTLPNPARFKVTTESWSIPCQTVPAPPFTALPTSGTVGLGMARAEPVLSWRCQSFDHASVADGNLPQDAAGPRGYRRAEDGREPSLWQRPGRPESRRLAPRDDRLDRGRSESAGRRSGREARGQEGGQRRCRRKPGEDQRIRHGHGGRSVRE